MARTEKLSNLSLRRRRLTFCANAVVSVMVAAPAIAMVLMNCRRDVVISIVVVVKGKDGARIERIATDFDGSIRGGQYTSVESVRQFASEITRAGLHFARLRTFNTHNSNVQTLTRIANHDSSY